MSEQRSSTDILLDIESLLDTLSKRIQNVENLQKILLQKHNKSASFSSAPIVQARPDFSAPVTHSPVDESVGRVVNKDNFENRASTSKFSEMAAGAGIVVEETSKEEETFVAKPIDYSTDDNTDLIESSVRGKSRGARAKQSISKKATVSQVLNKPGGGELFLANVEISNLQGELIQQVRTNTKGRWNCVLVPGEYQVHVTKRFSPDSGKESIDTTYKIDIPPSDKPMELSPLDLSG